MEPPLARLTLTVAHETRVLSVLAVGFACNPLVQRIDKIIDNNILIFMAFTFLKKFSYSSITS
jgi:hypothetical protein